jgi:hypothetical protein
LAINTRGAFETLPVSRGAADAAVDDELARPLRHLRVEVVHQHPERRFGEPALRGDFFPARRAYDAGIVDASHWPALSGKISEGIDSLDTE